MVLGSRKKEIADLKKRIVELEAEINRLKKTLNSAGIEDHAHFNLPVLSRLLEIHGLGIWILEPAGGILWLSSHAREILGVKDENGITTDAFRMIVIPEDRPGFDKVMNDLRPGCKPTELEFKIARSDGEGREFRLISMHVASLGVTDQKSGTVQLYAGSLRDITRQEKARRDLIRAKEKAEESERYKSILLTNISREIRTPMNSIIGFSELLNIGNLPYEKRLEYVKTIRNQGVYLLKMIDDVVELTNLESGKITIRKSPCNIDLLLNEILVVFNQYKVSQSKEHLDIRISYPPQRGLVIFTDPGRLQQLISNLINNSVKYTEKGYIEIGYQISGEQKIEFYVKDTGIGLTKDLQKRIFGKMAEEDTLASKSEGSGLGLTISKNLIRLLGGKIWVDSEPGQGSTFFFNIPLEEVPETFHQMTPEEEFVIPSYTWKDKVILIVEDDEVNFKFLEAVLQDTTVTILHASDGLQAVELCRSISKIDLVLMDIKMPEMDGFEATRLIREFNQKVPVIAQTAFVLENELSKCIDAGCNDQITKPIDIKEFFEKLDKYLREK
jgi:two-component system sensor histidine kinase/response regulator